MTEYFCPAGRLRMGPAIGRGGEGEVFSLADGSGRALKLYTDPDEGRAAKVESMVAAGLHRSCPDVAFPQAAVRDRDGAFVGFTMAHVDGCEPIHELYSPGSRRKAFPGVDWRFLVRASANVARTFGRIHAAGAIVGDVNGSGILVSRRAVVSMIDADSFQWRGHQCRVGVTEFTPPELQGRSLGGIHRSQDHDGFGLAVLIFHLLFLGRHPMAGVQSGRDVGLAEAIRTNLFAYSLVRRVRLSPPPGALLMSDIPPGMRLLFERAFAPAPGRRPLPAEWVDELGRLEAEMVSCRRDSRHFAAISTPSCPWCRMERSTGRPVFGPGSDPVTASRSVPPRLALRPLAHPAVEAALLRARRSAGEALLPLNRAHAGNRSKTAAIVAGLHSDGLVATVRVLTAAGGMGEHPLVAAFSTARTRLERELDDWRRRIGGWDANRDAAALESELRDCAKRAMRRTAELASVDQQLRAAEVGTHLAGVRLTEATIPGVGARRMGSMASSGIRVAADVSRTALENVGGLGEQAIISVLLWRTGVELAAERAITPDPARLDACRRSIGARHSREVEREGRSLEDMARRLDSALDEVDRMAALADPTLDSAVTAFARASRDLRRSGMIASVSAGVPIAQANQAAATTPSVVAKQKVRCPSCGGAMVRRWARNGTTPNTFFLGCASYPKCSGSRPLRRRTP